MLRTLLSILAVSVVAARAPHQFPLSVEPRVAAPAAKKAVSPLAAEKALELRGGGVVPQGIYIKTLSVLFGMYGAGMILAPTMVQEDNFVVEATPFVNMIWRGTGIFLFSYLFCLNNLAPDLAVKVALISTAALAAAVPYYGKFKGFTSYPNHVTSSCRAPLDPRASHLRFLTCALRACGSISRSTS